VALKSFRQKKEGLLQKDLECNLIEKDNVKGRILIKARISQRLSCRRLLEEISFTTSSIDLANCQVTNCVAVFLFCDSEFQARN
jgi:hypothetical protein